MYTIVYSKSFKKNFRKILKSGKYKNIEKDLERVLIVFQSGKLLDKKYKDHSLQGEFVGYKEFHLLPDLLIVYKIEKNKMILILVEIGSHSYLF